MTLTTMPDKIRERFEKHFALIYGDSQVDKCLKRLDKLLEKYDLSPAENSSFDEVWTHEDLVLITYGDMVHPEPGDLVSKLHKQHEFLVKKLKNIVSTVHFLPFFPSSSDDGFSVIDYKKVDETVGGWDDIEAFSDDFRLMADLVMNHTSRFSEWFQKYLDKESPYDDYFIEVDPDEDLSDVTRPRSSALLTPVHTNSGEKFVWCTFSDDQVDVNFANPDVLFEYIDIFLYYIARGISVVRLDAVAFIWKKIGTSCIHLEETHEIVKLFRSIVDHYCPESTIITETNVPHKENISYFGEGDEAHMVYQFSLPPLLLHALLTENAHYLTQWAKSLEELPGSCTYFNFTSSHDGIGVRPLEGLVPDKEFNMLVEGAREKGGFISEKQNPDGTLSPYELNITYFDALGDGDGKQSTKEKRFICSQVITMSLQGVPGIYFHNFTASRNNLKGVALTGRYRTINRKKWSFDALMDELNDPDSATYRIFNRLKELIQERRKHPAFDPFGKQIVYDAGNGLFCFERRDHAGREKILVIANVTNQSNRVSAEDIGASIKPDQNYEDLLSGKIFFENGTGAISPYQVVWIKL